MTDLTIADMTIADMPDIQLINVPGCPMQVLVRFLAKEWTTHILWVLGRQDHVRFGALRRSLPGAVSSRVLSARLKEMEHFGLVNRVDAGTTVLNVAYGLTDSGRHLDGALLKSEIYASRMPLPANLKPSAPA
jgi:DNA-binding HxlR family transcriptional regulator